MDRLTVEFVWIREEQGWEFDALLMRGGLLAAVGHGVTREEAEADARAQYAKESEELFVIVEVIPYGQEGA